jgi:hypothetical protein
VNVVDKSVARRGDVRVESINPIITPEGDLVVAGTQGTLLAWYSGEQNWAFVHNADMRSLVMVAWDDYLFVDAESEEDPPKACTLSKTALFLYATEVNNIRRVR